MDEIPLDPATAATVHYSDPRVRQLAEARWRLKTGGTRADWLALGKNNPEALIEEARDWVRAAVGTGLLPPPEPDPAFAIAMSSEQRSAEPGELCTCGRQAVIVFHSEQFGDAGHCGIEGAAFDPVLPCPWCASSEPHKASWGDPARCPEYTLRPGS